MSLPALAPPSLLDPSQPTGSQNISEGDDWLRYIQNVLKTYFPAIAGILSASHTELNYSVGVTSALQTQLDAKASNASVAAVAVGALSLSLETGTTVTAVIGTEHALTNVSATAATLPAAPVAGNLTRVTSANGLTTNTVDPGANKIMGVSGVLTIDRAYFGISLRYINSTIGWEIY